MYVPLPYVHCTPYLPSINLVDCVFGPERVSVALEGIVRQKDKFFVGRDAEEHSLDLEKSRVWHQFGLLGDGGAVHPAAEGQQHHGLLLAQVHHLIICVYIGLEREREREKQRVSDDDGLGNE